MKYILNLFQEYLSNIWNVLQNIINVPKKQAHIIMFIVCIALLLDNMLYMVIVSIRVIILTC
jgi:hypothetical protein